RSLGCDVLIPTSARRDAIARLCEMHPQTADLPALLPCGKVTPGRRRVATLRRDARNVAVTLSLRRAIAEQVYVVGWSSHVNAPACACLCLSPPRKTVGNR